ncbi:MAG: hypothetical protein KJ058_00360 [Thermoanaerobaculia bacterium]|nr:hypothetical protein [Thermoanaerobaculia bacterium]
MKMPRNRIIDVGVLLLVATALVWLGAELTRRIVWALPYAAGLGLLLLLVGVGQALFGARRQ